MILDEVMAGFGRTGTWFGVDRYGVVPDIMTFAKGVNNGMVPLGGLAISDELVETFAHRPYPGGLTYSGHPLACAAAVATIAAMEEEGVVAHAADLGREVFAPGLARLDQRHPSIGEVRDLGCFWALDLVTDRQTHEPLSPYGTANEAIGRTVAAARAAGLLVFTAMNRIHLAPPLTITAAEVEQGLDVLDHALEVAVEYSTESTQSAVLAGADA